MRMMRTAMALTALLAGTMQAAAQDQPVQPHRWRSQPPEEMQPPQRETPLVIGLRTKFGMVVVSNEPGHTWMVELRGQKIDTVPSDRPKFVVDGMPLQILAQRLPADPAGTGGNDTVRALIAHRDAELKEIAKDSKRSLRPRSETVQLADGSTALLWSFDMQNVDSPLFLSRVGPGYIMTLFVFVRGVRTEDGVRNWLVEAMNSFRFSDKPFVTAELRKQYPAPSAR